MEYYRVITHPNKGLSMWPRLLRKRSTGSSNKVVPEMMRVVVNSQAMILFPWRKYWPAQKLSSVCAYIHTEISLCTHSRTSCMLEDVVCMCDVRGQKGHREDVWVRVCLIKQEGKWHKKGKVDDRQQGWRGESGAWRIFHYKKDWKVVLSDKHGNLQKTSRTGFYKDLTEYLYKICQPMANHKGKGQFLCLSIYTCKLNC